MGGRTPQLSGLGAFTAQPLPAAPHPALDITDMLKLLTKVLPLQRLLLCLLLHLPGLCLLQPVTARAVPSAAAPAAAPAEPPDVVTRLPLILPPGAPRGGCWRVVAALR